MTSDQRKIWRVTSSNGARFCVEKRCHHGLENECTSIPQVHSSSFNGHGDLKNWSLGGDKLATRALWTTSVTFATWPTASISRTLAQYWLNVGLTLLITLGLAISLASLCSNDCKNAIGNAQTNVGMSHHPSSVSEIRWSSLGSMQGQHLWCWHYIDPRLGQTACCVTTWHVDLWSVTNC